MKVIFNTWSGAFFQKGGGETQLLQSRYALEKKGYKINFFDQWAPDEDGHILHQFAIQAGVEHVVSRFKDRGMAIALSPILWFSPDLGTHEYKRMKEILELSDVIFTNSFMETNLISDHFQIDKEKFIKTRNSISDAYLSNGQADIFRKKYGIHGDFILTVGNIDSRKGTHLLVEACKKLNKQLIVIGHIKEISYFNSFKDSYSNCRFLGPIESEELIKSAYSTCQLFALPSYCETPGIAALEAVSQGAPVVVTNEGSAQEYLGEYATYVSPWSLESVISGIEEGLKRGPISGGADFVRSNYTWDKTADEIESGYKLIVTPS